MQELYTKEKILSQFALADMKIQQEHYGEAVEIYRDLLNNVKSVNQTANIYNKLGNLYYKMKDFDNAISAYEKTLTVYNSNEYTYKMLGYLYFYKDMDKSIEYYLKGMEIKPDIKNFVMLTQVMIKSNQYSQKDLKNTFEKYVDYFRPVILNGVKPFEYDKKSFKKDKKLKIGYLSSDFYCHAMMSFVLPIIENHNFDEFDVTLYSCSKHQDTVTERLKSSGAKFKDCSGLTNSDIAREIHSDNIDILIDLSGYTHDAIWSLLYKPAPVIGQFLGFLGTYGMKEVDYILADKFTIPWKTTKYYTEKPMYINKGMNRFTFQTKNIKLPQITPLPYEENGYITFGSFNSVSKLNTQTLNLWSKVLKAVPKSKLLIYRTQMQQRDIDRFTKTFVENEIDMNRIIFDSEPMPDKHLSSYLKCDISLDPMPFSGLTVTIEQAYMGVPVLTLPKETIASKGTARVNRMLGLKNFIAKNDKDYVKKAVKIASDIKKLSYYRRNLPTIAENSKLCNDFKSYTKEIEKEYKKAWKKYCK